MKKEKSVPLSKDLESTRKLESLKFVFRSPKNALESGDYISYEWLEDNVIRKIASVEIRRGATGKDTAIIKMVNPDTNKEEAVYYTTDETQVARLKGISEGKTVVVDKTETE